MSDNKKVKVLPPIKRYVNAIERKLRLPRKIKARVMSDFCTTVAARHEQGESYDEITASLGSPADVAAELNEQMKEYTYTKSPWRFACLAVAIPAIGWLLFQVLVPAVTMLISFPSESASIGIIGGADGPTAILVATAPMSAGYLIEIVLAVLTITAAIYGFVRLGHIKHKDK